jgi:uncharacterized membrane protein YedE/YeeE
MISAHGPLSGHAYFLLWGVIQISLTNFVIIMVMLVIFALALILPFPHARDDIHEEGRDAQR